MCKLNRFRKNFLSTLNLKIYIGSPDNKSKEIKRETMFGVLEILSWITNMK